MLRRTCTRAIRGMLRGRRQRHCTRKRRVAAAGPRPDAPAIDATGHMVVAGHPQGWCLPAWTASLMLAPRPAVKRSCRSPARRFAGTLLRLPARTRAMPELSVLLLAACMFLGAALYTSVGHAGASAYIALMAIFGIAPASCDDRAGAQCFSRKLYVVPVHASGLVPLAHGLALPLRCDSVCFSGRRRPATGRVLPPAGRRSAAYWWREAVVAIRSTTNREPRDPPIWAGAVCGIGIGFLSGLTETGGGIFLSPLLLFVGWSATKPASGVAAVFILCNSIAGLLGNVAIVKALPPDLPTYAAAVALGAVLGTTLGIRWTTPMILRRWAPCSSSRD